MVETDFSEDVRIPSRSGSSNSLASQQSSHYTDQLDEDLSYIIAEYNEEEDKENSGACLTDRTLGVLNAAQSSRSSPHRQKQKRIAEEEPAGAPPRQIRKTTQELHSETRSEGSKDTVVGSVSSAGPSRQSSRTLVPTPAEFGRRTRPSAKSRATVTGPSAILPPAPPLVATPAIVVPPPPAAFTLPPEWQAPEPVIVAHSGHRYEQLIRVLPWGAQWEIARYVNMGFVLTEVPVPDLIALQKHPGNVTVVQEVRGLVERIADNKRASALRGDPEQFARAYSRELAAKLPWGELDKEETILRDHPLGGIGCNQHEEFCRDDPDWYGGRVHFIARLQRDSENRLGLELDRPVLGTSNRFARRFGSRRFIRVRIPQDFLMHSKSEDELLNYFKRPFVVGSAVFRAFYAKESNVFLFRTNEEVVRDPKAENLRVVQPAPGSLAEHSYMYLIEWHNSLKLNSEQTMVKWAARFALGLSNSVPGVRLRAANVRYADDIICDAFNGVGKPPSNMQMTDGCGFANRALTRALEAKFPHWREEPTAFQTRIGGAKGLQCVYHDLTPAEEEEPIVWLRPSQIKIKHSAHALPDCILHEDADPALLTIDVLRTSRMNTPARLAIETITNLAENGVPYSYFVSLFKMRLEERLDRLLAFDDGDPKSMLRLWNAIAREGAVINARMTREAAGIARAAGLTSRDYEDELEDEDEDGLDGLDKALREQSSAWWEDPISGCPSGLEETCLTMLDAGFTPQTCPVLRAKLMEVAKKVVTTFRTRYRTAVPMSCSAFIVPDPYGVLGPNEIHVKCSRGEFLDHKGRQTDIVLGDVLVTRHPCKVPSDVQKVKAVFHEKLRHYHNVIVVSTKNHLYRGKQLDRHLASLTGGGDYDGDTMEVFWDPDLVRYFKEPDPRKFAVEPPRVQECLVKNTETVASFLSRVPTSDAGEGMEYKISAMQDYLLGALKGSAYVSTYSIWWEKSTYKLGYSHDETIFLAYMFCAILDGSKTGVTVDPAAFKEHKAKWASGRLNWKDPDYDGMLVKRESGLGKFIMDALSSQVHSICEKERVRIDAHLGPLEGSAVKLDEDLARPYLLAKQHAQSLRDEGQPAKWDELRRIERHVEGIYAKALGAKNVPPTGRKTFATRAKGSAAGGGTKSPFTEMPIEKRQDILREQSKEFHAGPADLRCFDDPTAIKASYAYYYDYGRHKRRWSRFPWNVAMRALCEIKAKACGSSKTLSGEFYPWMAISPIYLR